MTCDHPFKHEDLPYRLSVGVMLLNKDGLVFVAKRIQQKFDGWQMPQGGIERGESPEEAALRELDEEIGTRNARLLREHDEWLSYDVPAHSLGVALNGLYRGQRQKWVAMRFLGGDTEINIRTAHPEFSDWRWLAIEAMPRVIVPFKRDTYTKIVAAFRDLAGPSI